MKNDILMRTSTQKKCDKDSNQIAFGLINRNLETSHTYAGMYVRAHTHTHTTHRNDDNSVIIISLLISS